MRKLTKPVKILIAAMLSIILAIIGVWVFLGGLSGAPLVADFQGYTTIEPLNGDSIDSTELTRIKEYGLDIWRFDYVLKYNSGVIVYQRKIGPYGDPASCKGSGIGSRGDYIRTCNETPFKKGGRYSVKTSKYKNELFSVGVAARIDSTEFYVSIPKDKLADYEHFDGWQKYFTSMEPINLKTMVYEKKETKPWGG